MYSRELYFISCPRHRCPLPMVFSTFRRVTEGMLKSINTRPTWNFHHRGVTRLEGNTLIKKMSWKSKVGKARTIIFKAKPGIKSKYKSWWIHTNFVTKKHGKWNLIVEIAIFFRFFWCLECFIMFMPIPHVKLSLLNKTCPCRGLHQFWIWTNGGQT